MNHAKFQDYHQEVTEALVALGNPAFGKAIQQDRGSQLEHLGVTFPNLRQRVRQGFSFYRLPEGKLLEVWDTLWQTSPYGEVLFAALEFYAPVVRNWVSPGLWPVVRRWSDRVDNWCHSDGLSAIYSRILESYPAEVFPQITSWNGAESEWLRRISLVSLIHYSGKNAVFLPPEKVLPLVSNCLDDSRHHVQTAVGWVLREMGRVYSGEITEYLEIHAGQMSAPAFSRAVERRSPAERTRLREARRLRLARGPGRAQLTPSSAHPESHTMVIVIMGVAGSGKTTVGTLLASTLGWDFIDADGLHPAENVRKMRAGIPLTDEDRRPWLVDLRALVARHAAGSESLVLACSALKSAYREVLASAAPGMAIIYLKANPGLARERLARRQGHYMPLALVESQFEALEEPPDALAIPAAWPPDQIVDAIRAALGV